MPIFLFADNAKSTLAAGIGPSATSITLAPGDGALFPSPGAGQQFALTLNDVATRLTYEVVYCTARSGDVLTVVRAQEGTSAHSWVIGDLCWNGPTSGQMAAMVQLPHMTDASIAPIFASVQVDGNLLVTNNAQFNGATFFGTTGQFYANPAGGGGPLINFDASQFLQFQPGTGFVLFTTGVIDLIAPSGVNVSAALTTNNAIVANAGNITAATGALRAGLGALGSGDANRATLLGDFTFTGTSPGWARMPSGIIMQWGLVTSAALTSSQSEGGLTWFFAVNAIAFPVTFPNAILSLNATPQDDGGHLLFNVNVDGWNTAGFESIPHTTSPAGGSINFFYTAIGY